MGALGSPPQEKFVVIIALTATIGEHNYRLNVASFPGPASFPSLAVHISFARGESLGMRLDLMYYN